MTQRKYCTPMLDGNGSVWMMEVSEATARGLRENGYRIEDITIPRNCEEKK